MFSNTFTRAGNNTDQASGRDSASAPKLYGTTKEANEALEREANHPVALRRREDYEKTQRRQRAEVILGQYDLLMKYAIDNQISIPQTRAYFRKVALGLETEAVIKNWFT